MQFPICTLLFHCLHIASGTVVLIAPVPILQASRYQYIFSQLINLFLNDNALSDRAKAGNKKKIATAAQLMFNCMERFCSSSEHTAITLMEGPFKLQTLSHEKGELLQNGHGVSPGTDQTVDAMLLLLALQSTATHSDSATVGWDWRMV